MEQTHYWMWKNKRKQHDLDSHLFTSSSTTNPLLAPTRGGDSWEELAFTEDAAAGALGGCVWPPRSYSCTFCKREFRSAQALGGHMNIHRRDRARLKQSQHPQTDQAFPHNNNSILLQHPGNILEAQSLHQICNYVFNPNLETTSSSPIRVSSSAPRFNSLNETQYLLFPYVHEQSTTFPPPKSNLNSVAELELTTPSWAEGDNNIVKLEIPRANNLESTTTTSNEGDVLKADLSISLNLVICRNNNPSSYSDDYEDGKCKRRRRIIDPGAGLNLFNNNEQDPHDVSTIRCIDDVDLELRLGDPPKVK